MPHLYGAKLMRFGTIEERGPLASALTPAALPPPDAAEGEEDAVSLMVFSGSEYFEADTIAVRHLGCRV